MKLLLSTASIVVVSVALFASASGQLLVEDFDYAAGQLITANGWTAHSAGGTNAIATVSPGLTFANYPSSGVGNAIAMTISGEDANRPFAVQSTGSVYAGFMVNISEAAIDPIGGYFFHLGPDPVSTTFRGRVFVKKDASNNLSFGLSKAATGDPNVAFTPFSFSLNTTYLIVLKYEIVDGATNDLVTMYIDPALPGGEPGSPTLTAIDVTATDISPGTVSVRQGSTTTSPTLQFDGIRVGTTWESVTSGGPVAPAQHVVDFNGDGRTDFATVRNTGGGADGQVTWFMSLNGPGTVSGAEWGIASDFFTPGDFDGDDKTDVVVWRPGAAGTAGFYILQSATSTFRFENFGQTGDDPTVIGDYDGDGQWDPAVYRGGATAGAQSTWFYRGSMLNPLGNITFVPWGQNGDFPAPGDYDGDGKGDFVIQRNNGGGQGIFWRQQTTAGFDTVVFGLPTDVIVPGDYDGDGKTDVATVRGSGGQIIWFYEPSGTAGVTVIQTAFGASATDFPTQGDYDGDGTTDQAIWRPDADPNQNYFWYNGSTSGVALSEWGQLDDYPVANYNSH